MDLLIGMVGALLGLAMFCTGFRFGRDYGIPVNKAETNNSEEYLNSLKEAKEQFAKEQAAFLNLMQYNANMAYGLDDNTRG